MSVINSNAHWNLVVSRDTDNALRQFLASQGKARKSDISRFVEEAVRSHILDLAATATKAENKAYSETEIENAIDEALAWAKQ
jgi:hypothetical protein